MAGQRFKQKTTVEPYLAQFWTRQNVLESLSLSKGSCQPANACHVKKHYQQPKNRACCPGKNIKLVSSFSRVRPNPSTLLKHFNPDQVSGPEHLQWRNMIPSAHPAPFIYTEHDRRLMAVPRCLFKHSKRCDDTFPVLSRTNPLCLNFNSLERLARPYLVVWPAGITLYAGGKHLDPGFRVPIPPGLCISSRP